ncbi:acyltransferase [Microbacterium barkeri]
MVLLFHFWPVALPGGYAGVDVFFVISGYLITSHLIRERDRSGRIDLPRFWARRARRLLPASLFVVLVSAVATWLVVPVTFWQDWYKQMAGAIAYVLNWLLAADSVDYLASENNASAVQHYWSLSVEEQFYIFWPLLILACAASLRKFPRRAIVFGISAITTLSLVVSVAMTISAPAAAYFVTPTRAWEFGVGALLVFLPAASNALIRAISGWAGLAAILATGLFYTAATPFPGYAALLPALGTALVIWSESTRYRWSFTIAANLRPLQYVGDISYSLYLWHWPLIVVTPYVTGRELSFLDTLALFVISLALAALTKKYIEDPLRMSPRLTSRRPRFTFAITAAAMVAVLSVSAGGFFVAREMKQNDMIAVTTLLEDSPDCFGAEALIRPDCDPTPLAGALFPSLAAVKSDTTLAYDCYANAPQNGRIESCTYGSESSDALRVAVTGDSHGAMLVAGFYPYLEDWNWSLDTYVSRGCTWADPSLDEQCAEYRANLADRLLEGDYDLIVTTAVRDADATTAEVQAFASARADAWAPVLEDGAHVAVVADNPRVPDDMVDCVTERPGPAIAAEDCVMPLDRLDSPADSGPIAADLEPRAQLIDTADLYCASNGCPMVIGNANVYRDQHHVTATYIITAAPYLAERIEGVATSRR